MLPPLRRHAGFCPFLNEDEIELYGIRAGNKAKEPLIHKEISLDEIRHEHFRFKEGGFYRVKLR